VTKPRVPFCWRCSRKLRGNFHRVVVLDGIERIVHAMCSGPPGKDGPLLEERPDLLDGDDR
jgi:hypothetical protein